MKEISIDELKNIIKGLEEYKKKEQIGIYNDFIIQKTDYPNGIYLSNLLYTKDGLFFTVWNNKENYTCRIKQNNQEIQKNSDDINVFIDDIDIFIEALKQKSNINDIKTYIDDRKRTQTYTKQYDLEFKNIILYGVPGVGKTHNYKRLINLIENGKNIKDIFTTIEQNEKYEDLLNIDEEEKRIKFITFHQNYSYEEFIEGLRPQKNRGIELKDGIFKQLCNEARNNKEKNYYLIIDEINRGNISKIFGELITLIEEDKRETIKVTLPYSQKTFTVPKNLYIIGTMNSTDKSIALIDTALRRRFTFVKLQPNSNLVENKIAQQYMKNLNEHLKNIKGEEYQVGHSYFMCISNDIDLNFIKEYKIKPLLEEYFYGDEVGLREVLKIGEGKESI